MLMMMIMIMMTMTMVTIDGDAKPAARPQDHARQDVIMMVMMTMMMTMTSDNHCCCPPLFLFTVRPNAAVGCDQMPPTRGANQSFIALAQSPTAGALPPIMDCMLLTISRS